MAEGESASKGITGFLSKDTAGLPNWAWLLVVGAGVAAVYILPKFTGKSSSTSSTDSSGLGLAIDPTTGLPYAVEGLSPSGGLAGGGGGGGGGGGTGAAPQFGTVRMAATDPNAPTYGADKAEPGIPVLSVPNANNLQQSEIGLASYGSQIQILGPAVQGGYNFGSSGLPGGSSLWYPVLFRGQQGYISAYDLLNMQSSNIRTNAATWPGAR